MLLATRELLTDKVVRAFFCLTLAWQLQDVRLISWGTDLCSCNNLVDPSTSRDLCGIVIDRLIDTAISSEIYTLSKEVQQNTSCTLNQFN